MALGARDGGVELLDGGAVLPVTTGLCTPFHFLYGGSGLAACAVAAEHVTGRPLKWITTQYVANAHPGCLHDCIFLICDTCGQITHLDDDRLTGGVREAAVAAGFTPVRPVIEVKGSCAECSATQG